jgi:hypothetical protein
LPRTDITCEHEEEIAMERNRNWQGWVAIALAGLALIVALGGRAPWGGRQSNMMTWSTSDNAPPMVQAIPVPPQVQQAPQAQQAPDGPRFGRGQGGHNFFMRGQDNPQGMMGHGEFRAGPMGRHGGPGIFGIFGIFGMLFGLAKLLALGLLAWLLLRTFMQRRNTPTATPPTTPAGHDPRVE